MVWIAKTDTRWRGLPERFGNWHSAWRCFNRWANMGIWQKLFEELQDP
jgi:transposase